MPRAVAFYTRLLGLRLTDHRDPASSSYIWVSFGSEDAPGSLNLSRVSEVGAPIHFGWQAEPALRDAYAAKLEAAGVAVRRTATSVYFLDPDGNELEITSWRWARG
jgi:catechol 2,3-dioxygenase-like lactoylglutathione lyase family enzyme